jgi:D-alanyl-D-alanine dipeptidase
VLGRAEQIVVVTTPGWDSLAGTLRRFERTSSKASWRSVGSAVPIVVGRTGLAWGVGFDDVGHSLDAKAPHKYEGDGRSPAGVFPLDTLFGFAARDSMPWARLPYTQLLPSSDCVDDSASAHYNTVVRRDDVPRIDWVSSEHMRTVGQYRLGVIVSYNAAPPVKGRGSCIFLHIWAGPRSTTAGCTALDVDQLQIVGAWLDDRRRPALVQLPAREYQRLKRNWALP